MTTDELIKELNELEHDLLAPGTDPEADHIKADWLLIDYINDERVTEAFDAITKWYS